MDFGELKNKFLSALGKTTDATKDFAGKAADTTKDIAGKAADKVKAGGRIAKLNIEIAQEKDNMKKTYVEIGKLYYDTHKDDPDGFFIQLCEEVAAAEKAIAETPELFNSPIVRNGKKATVGYCPDVWEQWANET